MDAKQLQELLDAATPGPWAAEADQNTEDEDVWSVYPHNNYLVSIAEWVYSDDNARLIAMAPDLARRVIAAEKLVEALREIVEFNPTVFSGRAHDPQDDQDDLMPVGEFEVLQDDAKTALAEWEANQ